MFEALQEIEALCASRAAERATGVEIAALEQANLRLGRLARSRDRERAAREMKRHVTTVHGKYRDFSLAD